jgi:glycine cleavage system H protein
MSERWFDSSGYRLAADRLYHPELHFWIQLQGASGRARVGFDPLGRETRGDVVELSLAEVGQRIDQGRSFGSLEAAKFVGPLEAPVSGVVTAVNGEVLANPGSLNDDPNLAWLVEVELTNPSELDRLLRGEERVRPWFAAEVERYRREGAVAE